MFASAVFKLTVWYVAALLIVTTIFSLTIFGIASNRLDRATVRTALSRTLLSSNISSSSISTSISTGPLNEDRLPPEYTLARRQLVQQEQSELLKEMIFVDVAIVLLGAVAGYFFAKRTLMPIEEAHEAQSRFTADASHELRTPLAVMQTEIEVALRNKNTDKKILKETLSSSLEEIARLRILSNQLLALTKVDTDVLGHEEFSLSKATSKRLGELKKQHALEFSEHIEPNITFNGDKLLLMEIVTILVSNAVQYSGKNPKISIDLKKDSDQIILQVSDNGSGIKGGDLDKIFERFYRGSNSHMQKTGHGLGLSLAQGIAHKSGGEITVKSKIGEGSSFTLTLPNN